jgi:hypothetical protein
VRLAADPDGLERVEDGPAFYFQFACQIVDSNFAHPSLYNFLTYAAQPFIRASFEVEVCSLLWLNLSETLRLRGETIPPLRSGMTKTEMRSGWRRA